MGGLLYPSFVLAAAALVAIDAATRWRRARRGAARTKDSPPLTHRGG
ncbi:hypothetical protein [Streptomyces asiaticus]